VCAQVLESRRIGEPFVRGAVARDPVLRRYLDHFLPVHRHDLLQHILQLHKLLQGTANRRMKASMVAELHVGY
jgi:hypothetical protein